MRKKLILSLAAALCVMAPAIQGASDADTLDRALDSQGHIQREAVESQARIDALDDEARGLLEDYLKTRAELENLEKYNARMERMVASQHGAIVDLEQQIRELEQTRRRILPLMSDMVDALDAFVAADVPFLPRERGLRLKELRALQDDPAVTLADKYRRLLEAYRIEADYGYGIEAYSGELVLDGRALNVDFLRLGRAGLYWLTPDRARAGVWDPEADRWRELEPAHAADIELALRVARKQAPPDWLILPLPAAEPRP